MKITDALTCEVFGPGIHDYRLVPRKRTPTTDALPAAGAGGHPMIYSAERFRAAQRAAALRNPGKPTTPAEINHRNSKFWASTDNDPPEAA